MPKTVTADKASVSQIRIKLEGTQVIGLEVFVTVNYGTFGRDESVDFWGDLTATQKTALQGIANKVAQRIQELYIN